MRTIIIDGKGHLFGRLASVCAKELLKGKKIVVVRCEKIEISGKHVKNKLRILKKFKKRTNTNHKHGPFHFKTPSQIFWKGLRGMLPHKTKKGTRSLLNVKLFEGTPNSLKAVKKMKIASALRISKLSADRKFSNLGDIANEIGWKRKKLIDELSDAKKCLKKISKNHEQESSFNAKNKTIQKTGYHEIVSRYFSKKFIGESYWITKFSLESNRYKKKISNYKKQEQLLTNFKKENIEKFSDYSQKYTFFTKKALYEPKECQNVSNDKYKNCQYKILNKLYSD